jgi:hypothetical protein
MRTYKAVKIYLLAFLFSVLGGSEESASRPKDFTLRKRAPDTYWI